MTRWQAQQAVNNILVCTSREGYGYTYAVSAQGVVVAQGWIRSESEDFVLQTVTELGKIAVRQWIGSDSDPDTTTQPMIKL